MPPVDFVLQLLRLSWAWRCSNVTMHRNPALFSIQTQRSKLVCLDWPNSVLLASPHGEKWRLHLFALLYVCAFIQLIDLSWNTMSMFWVALFFILFFTYWEQHGFSLLPATSVRCPCFQNGVVTVWGSLVITAFTSNVCALFLWVSGCRCFACYWCIFTMNHVLDIPCLSLSLSSCFAFGPIHLGQKRRK